MRLALPLFLLLTALASACKSVPANVESHGASDVRHSPGRYSEIRFPPGQESYSVEGEGGALRLTITRIKNDYKKAKVVVTFELRNAFDQEIRFALNDTRLTYAGDEYAAKAADLFRLDPNPNILPKSTKKGAWAFELGSVASPGVYEAHIRGLQLFGSGSPSPLGKDLVFQVKVPGERAPG